MLDQKWEGIGYAHPHNERDVQQAIHWARIAAKMTQIQSLYLSQRTLIGTTTLTHTPAHSRTHKSLLTLLQTPSDKKNPQYSPNSIP